MMLIQLDREEAVEFSHHNYANNLVVRLSNASRMCCCEGKRLLEENNKVLRGVGAMSAKPT